MRSLKKCISALIATTMLFSALCMPGSVSAESFSDVNEVHWAYKAIERCKAKNWFNGYPDGRFNPDGSLTRAEAIKVFVTFLGEPLNTVTQSTYYDVSPTAWYAPYIEAGKELFPKRTSLDGQLKFQPDMPVTREDIIYAIVVALGYTDETQFADESVLNMFSDQNSISSNVRAYAAVAVSNSFVSGHSDGTIGGQDPLTRAQFATLLSRASEIGPKYKNNPIPKDVSITPEVMQELSVGETLTLSSVMTYSDDTTADYSTNMNPYTDNTENIVSFNKNQITALKEGTVIVQFNNTHLADKSLVIVVKDNSEAPIINITQYEPFLENTSAEISGTVSDTSGSAITLTCNNNRIMLNGDGSFKTSVNLKEGANSFELKAVNGHGKTTTKTVDIYRSVPKPTAAPTAPATTQPFVSVQATVEPTATIKPTSTPAPTPSPTVYVTEKPTLAPATPTPAPPTKAPSKQNPAVTAEISDSGDTVTVLVSYDGFGNADVTSAQFVLAMDSAKYTYSAGKSISYFGGAAAYQKTRGGVKYVYANKNGITSSSGTFAKLVFTINEGCSYSKSDFSLRNLKLVNDSVTYSDDDISININ